MFLRRLPLMHFKLNSTSTRSQSYSSTALQGLRWRLAVLPFVPREIRWAIQCIMAVLRDLSIDLNNVDNLESAFQYPQQQSPKSCLQDSSACRLGATASLTRAIYPTIGPLSGLKAAQHSSDIQHRSVPRHCIKVAEAQPQGISEQKEEVRKQERSLRARNRSEKKPKVQKTAPNCKLSISKQKLMTESKEGNDQIIFDCFAYICQRSLTRVL